MWDFLLVCPPIPLSLPRITSQRADNHTINLPGGTGALRVLEQPVENEPAYESRCFQKYTGPTVCLWDVCLLRDRFSYPCCLCMTHIMNKDGYFNHWECWSTSNPFLKNFDDTRHCDDFNWWVRPLHFCNLETSLVLIALFGLFILVFIHTYI